MKNLFKNLMLVAVAAMAFTACTETNEEVNAVSKKTVLNFVATIDNDGDDTRSGFVGSTTDENDVTEYQSAWDGTEKLVVRNMNDNSLIDDAVEINTEGQFSVEFEEGEIVPDFINVYSPASAWNGTEVVIPSEQKPRANSVDPAAHVLSGYVQTTDGSSFTMSHQVGYGKMTIKGLDFKAARVELNLKGDVWGTSYDFTYTLDGTNVENNVFWFATKQFLNVSEFTVVAYDAEDNAFSKTVVLSELEGDRKLQFNYNTVGAFSVSGLETVEVTYDSTYAYIYEGSVQYNDVTYMFVADDNRGLRIDFCGVIVDGAIPAGTYTFSTSYGMYPNWCFYYANVDSYYTSKLTGGQAVVSVEDGQYKIVFTNMALGSTVYVEQFTFKGELPDLVVPDPRVKLATPEVTYTNEDKVVTLSWNAIEGVEYYSVECDSEAIDNFTTTETSATITLPEYGVYDFSVAAKVADNHENYRSSDAASVKVVVKDPSAWADYELTSVALSGNYVTMTDANDNRVTFFMNAADRIGNGIKLGDYTFVASEDPAVGTFVTYIVAYDGTWKYAYQIGSGSMSVEEENGEYKILITVDGIRFGYVGTEALGAPITGPTIIASTDTLSFVQAGGNKTIDLTLANLTEDITVTSTNNHFTATVIGNVLTVVAPENPVEAAQEAIITLSANGATATITVTQEAYDPNFVAEDGSEEHPYTFASVASNGFYLNFEDATNGASLQLDRQNSDVNVMSNYGGPFALNYTAIIYAGSGCIYNVGGNVYDYASFAPYSTLEVTKADGNWTCKLKMSVDAGATYTYYTYTGQIANQAY